MAEKITISIIVAMDKNRLIGNNKTKNGLPWHLPADLKHFKQITSGKTIIMGKNTFLVIGKSLKNRTNIVLTKNNDKRLMGCLSAFSINEAIETAKKFGNELFICGGRSIYGQFLSLADKMFLTIIDGEFEGDVYFPDYDVNLWKEVERKTFEPDNKNLYKYSFVELVKKN